MTQNSASHNKRRNRFRFVLILILWILIVAYVFGSFLTFHIITESPRQFAQAQVASDVVDVTFPARDQDYEVYAYFYPVEESEQVLISVHGYGMSRHAEYNQHRSMGLQELGYNVLSPDLSDHAGDTRDNNRISFGAGEVFDVLGAVDYLLGQGYLSENIGLVGDSLGGTTSLMAAINEPCIPAIWVDSAYSDAVDVIRDGLSTSGYPDFLSYGAMIWANLLMDEDMTTVSPVEHAQNIADAGQAVYLVANPDDSVVPFYHGERLRDALEDAGTNVTFWEVPDVIHADTINVYYDEYMTRLDTFFQQYLGQSGPDCTR